MRQLNFGKFMKIQATDRKYLCRGHQTVKSRHTVYRVEEQDETRDFQLNVDAISVQTDWYRPAVHQCKWDVHVQYNIIRSVAARAHAHTVDFAIHFTSNARTSVNA